MCALVDMCEPCSCIISSVDSYFTPAQFLRVHCSFLQCVCVKERVCCKYKAVVAACTPVGNVVCYDVFRICSVSHFYSDLIAALCMAASKKYSSLMSCACHMISEC